MFAPPHSYMPMGDTKGGTQYNSVQGFGGYGAHVDYSAKDSHNSGGGEYMPGGAFHQSGAPNYRGTTQSKGGALNNSSGGHVGPNNNGRGYPMARNGGNVKGGNVNGNAFHQGGVPNPNAQPPGAPIFGPPNSIPCANGTSAWCKRCGFSNDIKAYKCDQCNLQLLVDGYPSEPPPGNHGICSSAHLYSGGAQQHGGPQQFGGDAVSKGGGIAQQFRGGAQQCGGAQQLGGGAQQYNGGPQQFSGGAHSKGGKSGGKGVQVKWCLDCGQQNPYFHKWCNTCHAQLPHSGKGNVAPHVAYTQLQSNTNVQQGGGNRVPNQWPPPGAPAGSWQNGSWIPQGGAMQKGNQQLGTPQQQGGTQHQKGGQQQPYSLEPQRFNQESAMYPGRIPRCFAVGFEAGQYIAPVNLPPVAQWKSNCEYLNHIKLIQSKVETYKDFLKDVEMKLLSCALPAWKHHKELESTMDGLPDAAKGLHTPPLHLLAELMFDQIDDEEKKSAFESLVLDILKDQASPTPPSSPRPHQHHSGSDPDQHMEPIEIDESFEIPQWVPAQCNEVLDPSEVEYLREMEEELTPCLPKRQRLFSKTPHNVAVLGKTTHTGGAQHNQGATGKGKGSVSHDRNNAIHRDKHNGGSSSDDDSDAKLTKREKKAADKQRRRDALLAASPSCASQARKSINKPKKF